MKSKVKLKTKRTVQRPALQKVVQPDSVQLPKQKVDDIQLLDTDSRLLLELAKPNLFREAVLKQKREFLQEIQELAGQCGLEADVRIYFTFKLKE